MIDCEFVDNSWDWASKSEYPILVKHQRSGCPYWTNNC